MKEKNRQEEDARIEVTTDPRSPFLPGMAQVTGGDLQQAEGLLELQLSRRRQEQGSSTEIRECPQPYKQLMNSKTCFRAFKSTIQGADGFYNCFQKGNSSSVDCKLDQAELHKPTVFSKVIVLR